MTSLDIDDRGLTTLALPDTKGELHAYRFEVVSPSVGLSLWSLRFVRCDPAPGSDGDYLARMLSLGRWDCSCPDWKFRGYRKRQERSCKHVLAAMAYAAFLATVKSPLAPPSRTLENHDHNSSGRKASQSERLS